MSALLPLPASGGGRRGKWVGVPFRDAPLKVCVGCMGSGELIDLLPGGGEGPRGLGCMAGSNAREVRGAAALRRADASPPIATGPEPRLAAVGRRVLVVGSRMGPSARREARQQCSDQGPTSIHAYVPGASARAPVVALAQDVAGVGMGAAHRSAPGQARRRLPSWWPAQKPDGGVPFHDAPIYGGLIGWCRCLWMMLAGSPSRVIGVLVCGDQAFGIDREGL